MIIQPLTSTSPPITPRTTAVDAPGRPVDELAGTRVDTGETSSGTRVEPEQRGIEDVVKEVNDFIKPFNNALQFSIDDTTGTTIGQLKGLLVKQQA